MTWTMVLFMWGVIALLVMAYLELREHEKKLQFLREITQAQQEHIKQVEQQLRQHIIGGG